MPEKSKIKKASPVQSRIGGKFRRKIEEIKDARLINGKSKDRISTEKITNMIVRHNDWSKISKHIIEAKEEEINTYGK